MAREHPVHHYTAQSGWINDPHGVVFDGNNWHLFYQANPTHPKWEQGIVWGHAISPDLFHWTEQEIALTPLEEEVGCWSGSVVFDEFQTPWMFYTSPHPDEWGHGRVIRARGSADLGRWQREPNDFLIDGPPEDCYFDFRDPNVWREGSTWRMVVGAGKRDFGGAVLSYTSADLVNWKFAGELVSRERGLILDTGTVWECPQYLEVDGRRVLLFSAMDGADLSQMMYAVGDEVDGKFIPKNYGLFEFSKRGYATTTFRDQSDQPCLITWIRELPNIEVEDFSGAQSLTLRMSVVEDELLLDWHPDVITGLGQKLQRFDFETGQEVALNADPTLGEVLLKSTDATSLELWQAGQLVCSSPSQLGSEVSVVVDQDIVEWLVAGVPGCVTARLKPPRLLSRD